MQVPMPIQTGRGNQSDNEFGKGDELNRSPEDQTRQTEGNNIEAERKPIDQRGIRDPEADQSQDTGTEN